MIGFLGGRYKYIFKVCVMNVCVCFAGGGQRNRETERERDEKVTEERIGRRKISCCD